VNLGLGGRSQRKFLESPSDARSEQIDKISVFWRFNEGRHMTVPFSVLLDFVKQYSLPDPAQAEQDLRSAGPTNQGTLQGDGRILDDLVAPG
jgi:hypothetical protein